MSDQARRAFATRDAVRLQHQADSQPHRVILRPAREPWERRQPGPKAWCTKPGCRWTWDGIGRLDYFRAEHEKLNDPPAAATNPEQDES
jgi:hypothetical protein